MQHTEPKKNNGAKKNGDFLTVGIGASAGGIKALKEFFSVMPADSGMAFVVVLHLSPEHESNLAHVLQSETRMPVLQVVEPTHIKPDHVYVIPPNRHLVMVDGTVQLARPAKGRGSRVAIDLFFRTLADAHGRKAVCIVLSGTGSDGTLGLKAIKERKGFAIVQKPEDAEYDGMPRSAINTNLADVILPAVEMPDKLLSVRDSTEKFNLIDGNEEKVATEIKGVEALRDILTLLRIRTGHDFSNYKHPTLLRRIARHLQIHELDDMPSYVEVLRESPEEVQSLLHNLLINVTNFFRDKKAFDALENEVIPLLFTNREANNQVRVWVAGCATGEEAYSIAILLAEYAARRNDPPKIQIFASDVDEDAITSAREGRYTEAIQTDISAERLRRFFTKEGSSYRVKKQLREMVLFATHNVLRDPPFSRLDLVSCRNVLIYINKETQEKVLKIFHFALKADGFLFLGNSESTEGADPVFTPVNKKQRIYSRHNLGVYLPSAPPLMPLAGKWQVKLPGISDRDRNRRVSFGELHYKLVEQYAPPSVLVNEDFDIVHLSESAGKYLHFSGGEPTSNLLKVVYADLLPDLRAALFSSQRERKTSEFQNIAIELDGKKVLVNLVIRPVEISESKQGFLLVIFDESEAPPAPMEHAEHASQTIAGDDAMESVVRQIEEDLRRTKDRLRTTIEQHETSNEELKASNEELQAMNEELRLAGEELETSKEELQSINEELTTVNQELKEKVEEVSRANSDLNNLMSSTHIGTVFLDRDLNINRFTPSLKGLFNIIPSDIGRPMEHVTHKLRYKNFTEDANKVLKTLRMVEHPVESEDGQSFIVRFLPYRTLEDRIDGVVVTFIDVTERAKAEKVIARLAAIVESSDDAIVGLDMNGIITDWNPGAEMMYGYSAAEVVGKTTKIIIPSERLDEELAILERIKQGERLEHFETVRCHRDGSIVHISLSISPIWDEAGNMTGISKIARDLTSRKQTQKALRDSEERLDLVMKSVIDYAIITTDVNGLITGWNPGAKKMFGYTLDEILGKTADVIFTPEDRKKGVPQKEMKKAATEGRAEDERWHLRKDGSRFYVSGVTSPLKDGDLRGFVKIARDQTEKLKAEAAVRDKEMLQRLVAAQEDERQRIARDLHDQLGQQMTALRLNLEALKNSCGDNKTLIKEVEKTQKHAKQMDSDVSFLAWELRPTALDDLGLRAALGNFVKEWSRNYGIAAEFHTARVRRTRLIPEIEINIYRIAQEALNNILKHAQAKHASVLFEFRKDQVVLIVEDDGVGFDPEANMAVGRSGKGLGLIGMQERAALVGGAVEIESSPGKGTTIFVRIPVRFAAGEISDE
jgi:two-component system CheB/CheR fusion protein